MIVRHGVAVRLSVTSLNKEILGMDEFLVYAKILDGQGGARDISEAELSTWQPEQGLLWLHFDYSKPETLSWLEDHSGLDDIAISALVAEDTRPRATSHCGGLLMALRGVNMNPEADPEDMVSIRLFVHEHRIISSRKRQLLSVDDIVRSFKEGEGPETSSEFVAMLCDRLVRRMAGPIDNAEDKVDELEENLLSSARAKLRSELGQVRRQSIALRRYLAPQRDALSWVQSERLPWFGDDQRRHVREVSDRLAQYIETLDSIRERAAVSQEELVNQISEESNNRMYVLSIVSAIFLPLGFATGLLGINVGGIPGADNGDAFAIFIGILVAISGALLVFFRYKKWL
ncbi:Zinc transport protein ZntB [Zhongshania aliphaticivorans]|uniref:Zinc transport protein ZntB n=1 Tax=Zhongshania aliphaticivorans TaxID=1470434 RepID=A0A5S9PQ51_9GAMM|nr:zinc transporter ZntB [Zhongshania aliphaticivorans]CAA0105905.1 Zinc transport protein ZntB [Zhongshania aliphaticivorans]CAA0106094.1 Zinc transport protein ZntB [Zhongshania aliphaticivorans]